jgi:hypothetical protein
MNKAAKDVRALHECPSKAVHDKLLEMVLKDWRSDGEDRIADTFYKEYVANEIFNKWVRKPIHRWKDDSEAPIPYLVQH